MYISVMIFCFHTIKIHPAKKKHHQYIWTIWQIYTASCAGQVGETESNCEGQWSCAYYGLVWFMYKVTLVTSLSETVESMQQFPSSSCNPCVIFCYYSSVVLQSYLLVSFCVCVCVCERERDRERGGGGAFWRRKRSASSFLYMRRWKS